MQNLLAIHAQRDIGFALREKRRSVVVVTDSILPSRLVPAAGPSSLCASSKPGRADCFQPRLRAESSMALRT